jgi:hypothetical protein
LAVGSRASGRIWLRAGSDWLGEGRGDRIWQDGTMWRRIVDTAQRSDGRHWAKLVARVLAVQPRTGRTRAAPFTTSALMITWSWPPSTTLPGRCWTRSGRYLRRAKRC